MGYGRKCRFLFLLLLRYVLSRKDDNVCSEAKAFPSSFEMGLRLYVCACVCVVEPASADFSMYLCSVITGVTIAHLWLKL